VRSRPIAGYGADLQQLDWRDVDLDERNRHSNAWAVGFNDDAVSLECRREVVYFEGNVWHGLDKVGVGRIVPVALPLDTEGVVLVIAPSSSDAGAESRPQK
jgi:hypothetical protein